MDQARAGPVEAWAVIQSADARRAHPAHPPPAPGGGVGEHLRLPRRSVGGAAAVRLPAPSHRCLGPPRVASGASDRRGEPIAALRDAGAALPSRWTLCDSDRGRPRAVWGADARGMEAASEVATRRALARLLRSEAACGGAAGAAWNRADASDGASLAAPRFALRASRRRSRRAQAACCRAGCRDERRGP